MHRNALFAVIAGGAIAAPALAMPMTVADLGVLTGDTQVVVDIDPNEVAWVSFTLPAGGTYLDLNTNGSGIDTEMGLYDDAGARVANDDDDGIGLTSTLSFGAGSGLMLGDSFNLGGDGIADGDDGPLGPGTYFVALGEFDVTFNDTMFDVVSTGTDSGGRIILDVYTDVPAPAAASVLGIAGLAAVRRRR
jgi:MYXO-CTERM domain-containing protein